MDRFFTVYVPTTPRPGIEGAAQAAEEFGRSLAPADGAALQLVAASLWLEADDPNRSQDLVTSLWSEEELRPAVIQAIGDGPLESFLDG